jgi:hypothetical protein
MFAEGAISEENHPLAEEFWGEFDDKIINIEKCQEFIMKFWTNEMAHSVYTMV